jgi:hypothetical protein
MGIGVLFILPGITGDWLGLGFAKPRVRVPQRILPAKSGRNVGKKSAKL